MGDSLNDNEEKGPASGNTAITTINGETIKIEMENDMVHFEKPFKCLKCGRDIDTITKNYKCPHCNRDYEEMLI